jgi:hypothetical protein
MQIISAKLEGLVPNFQILANLTKYTTNRLEIIINQLMQANILEITINLQLFFVNKPQISIRFFE